MCSVLDILTPLFVIGLVPPTISFHRVLVSSRHRVVMILGVDICFTH